MGLYLPCMSTQCIHCKRRIDVEDGAFIVFGHPYFGAMHRRCVPMFKFNGDWPHPFPSVVYVSQGGDSKWPLP
jgi:hypothetical protein